MVSPLDWSQSRQGVMSHYKLGMSTGYSLEDFSCLNCFAVTVAHQLSELLTEHNYLESMFIILSARSQKMIERCFWIRCSCAHEGKHEEIVVFDVLQCRFTYWKHFIYALHKIHYYFTSSSLFSI